MRICAFDTETSLIRPGLTAPPISCLSYQVHDDGISSDPILVRWTDASALLLDWLEDKDTVVVGHNVAFDLAVVCAEWPELVPLVFRAFDEDRITDTMLRGKLLDIAGGCYRGKFGEEGKWIKLDYSLLALAKRWAGIPIKKEGFRMFYGPLRDVPLEGWVEAAKTMQVRGQTWLTGMSDADLDGLCAAFGDHEKFRKEVQGMIAADPREVITYPLDDARSTLAVYLAQEAHADPYLADQFRQARKAWWLRLTSAWGLRTNAAGVAALQRQTELTCDELQARLVAEGLVRPDGSRDTKAAKERVLQVCGWRWDEGLGKFERTNENAMPLRLTDSGEPSLDSDACKATEDEILQAYAEFTSLKTVLNKDIPALARGTIYPVHTNWDMAETGRVTSSGPNVQNWARERKCLPCKGKGCAACKGKGKLPGVRECFVPRPGHVFAQADYSGLELATLAQACLDILRHSALAIALNEGKDPHTDLAALILGISYEEALARKDKSHPLHKGFDDTRQTAKVVNFGFPGGLGPAKLTLFARKTYGVEMSEEEAKKLKHIWLAKWPEMQEYFAHVNGLPSDEEGRRSLVQLRSGRHRGGALYTEACNSYFQGLGADATAHAGWLIAKACYVERSSPLFNSRIVNYVHDEFILETREDVAPEAAEELSRLMLLGAKPWIPDVALAAEPCLMRVWSKDAKTLRDPTGRLVPWMPAA